MLARKIACCKRAAVAALVAGCAGCSVFVPLQRGPTEADFATITPGMTRDEVVSRFGRPTWVFGVRQENLTILNYRYNHNDCWIYQVSVRPDGIVRDAAPGYDPACDGPSGRD
jgi:outer membrane protein assembly factor BamE (lipoprotein component of BamABCDE complex)